MGKFSAGIAGYAKRAGVSIGRAVADVCMGTAIRTIDKTPKDKGTAQGNWFAKINSVSNETSETRTEAEAILDATNTAQKASGNIFYLTNNLDYIRKLEYGWSKQAPNGMLRLSIAETENALKGFK